MSETTVELKDGLATEGGHVLKEAVLRELTAGDILDASREAEQLVMTPQGYQLVTSQAALGFALLRRQVASIGDIDVVTADMLRRLSSYDFELLQDRVQALGSAAQEVAQRGRGEGADEGSEAADR